MNLLVKWKIANNIKGFFDIMVRGRWLFYTVQLMNGDFAYSTVAGNLLHSQSGLSWNNEANRVRIITYEMRDIIHLLEGLGRFDINEEDEELARTLIISLNNALTNLNPPLDNNGIGGFRKRKRKSIKTKSKKTKKLKKSRKSRN
jgi:hypothetical protein